MLTTPGQGPYSISQADVVCLEETNSCVLCPLSELYSQTQLSHKAVRRSVQSGHEMVWPGFQRGLLPCRVLVFHPGGSMPWGPAGLQQMWQHGRDFLWGQNG